MLCSLEEHGLVRHLLTNYSTTVRPVEHHDHQIVVSVGIAINQLIDLVCRAH